MDKFNVFFLVVMALVAATSSAPSIIRSDGTPRFSEVLIGSAQNSQQVPVQPVEETAEEGGEEAVVVAEPEGSGAVIEERQTPVVVPEADLCADVSGVWQSQSSEARLVLAEDDERDLDGLYRNDSESGWYKLRGHRGSHEGAAFAFSVIWQEGNAASSVVGHCHSCTDDAPTLEMHSVHSFRTPECGSRVVTILDKSYNKVADAAEARLLLKDMLGDDTEEEAGEPAEEEAETQQAQAEESPVEVINVEIKETETGSGDA